jgi:hypothetical protein
LIRSKKMNEAERHLQTNFGDGKKRVLETVSPIWQKR